MTAAITDPAPADGWTGAFLSMARELWVLKDRQRVLEALLAKHGILAAEAVSTWQPDAAIQADLERECRAFIDRLLAELPASRAGAATP